MQKKILEEAVGDGKKFVVERMRTLSASERECIRAYAEMPEVVRSDLRGYRKGQLLNWGDPQIITEQGYSLIILPQTPKNPSFPYFTGSHNIPYT